MVPEHTQKCMAFEYYDYSDRSIGAIARHYKVCWQTANKYIMKHALWALEEHKKTEDEDPRYPRPRMGAWKPM